MSFLFLILLYQSRDRAKGVSIVAVLLTALSLPVVKAQDASDNTTTWVLILEEKKSKLEARTLPSFFVFCKLFKLFPFNSWAGISLKWQ